ncbi:NUDIX hydrolase [Dermatobacter hominis]|uniref:NUDIX hydrolase n=1 Tax=Dermatobacter hominis TaxID=2884263 RepID=UPI001D104E12|nr:NUDIX domain-containing protein [Dermatobacter hominis]UDY36373.1 NUDIX domain-containing protein [Dermatobacter hominis]
MVDPVVVAGAVATRGNDLLVVRRDGGPAEGRWSVPLARVAGGETMVEAAVRAVAEQTGLGALSGPFLGWYESIRTADPGGAHEVVACFTSVILDAVDPTAGAEVAEARWMPVWDVAELPLVDGLAELLAEHGVIDTLA